MRLWVPYAGSLGVGRAAVGAGPLIAFMGRKDRLAPHILEALGNPKPSALGVNDCGLWGDVWRELFQRGPEVVASLDSWSSLDRCALWDALADIPPMGGPRGVAQFLYLQGRSVRGVPLYWLDGRWVCHRANGSVKAAAQRQAPRPDGSGGGITAAGIARRVRALVDHDGWPPVKVFVVDAAALPWHQLRHGDVVYLDPVYQGCTPYEHTHGRDDVLALARMCARRGATVAVSEAVPLTDALLGWRSIDLTPYGHGKPEWLTITPEIQK